MNLDAILIYGLTVFIASIIPGPSMLLALTHGMQHGTRRTMASAMGNLTVTLLQASISIAGLGAVLVASEGLFQIIRYAGAAYLVYMGVGLMRAGPLILAFDSDQPPLPRVPRRRMFFQAAVVTAGNPKAIVFFTAIFPQFLDPQATFGAQFCLLMGIGAAIAFGCFMLYALAGQKIIVLFSKVRVGKYINRLVGGGFILAALGLAVSRR